jgi:hypothetical protein
MDHLLEDLTLPVYKHEPFAYVEIRRPLQLVPFIFRSPVRL